MDLTGDEQRKLSLFIEASRKIESEAQFIQTLHPIVNELFPHKMFICGFGSISDGYVHQLLNVSFPKEYISLIIADNGIVTSPISRLWLQDHQPIYFSQNNISDTQVIDATWLSIFEKFNIKNIAAHGFIDSNAAIVSYFSFANISFPWNEKAVFMIELLIPHLHTALVKVKNSKNRSIDNKLTLSKREREVLKWICLGKTNEEISLILDLSIWTVKTHVKNLIKKMDVSTRSHAAAKAIRNGIIQI